MDPIKLLLCRYGSEVLVVRLVGGIKLYDVFRKICDRWQTLCIGRFSLSYDLDGSDCKLVDEEDFDNMIYLSPDSNKIYARVEDVRSSIGSSGGCSSVVTFRSNSGGRSSSGLEDVDEEEPLDKFCRHTETRYLTSGWVNLIHSVGQVFRGGVTDFRGVLQRYAIENGFMYDFVKNDKLRVTAVCKVDKCEWRVHAILDRTTGEFVIKELNNDHHCGSTYRRNKHKRVTSSLVAVEISSMVQQNNNASPMDMLQFFTDKYGLDLSYHHAWLGVEKARGKIFGDYESSFDKLRWYVEACKVANPGSILKLETDSETKEFSRLFVSFNACITGFNNCRPFLCLDGAHLRGRFKGTLLAATGKDADQGLFPLAFAIVNAENDANWLWFLQLLQSCLSGRPITFISDRNHGLVTNIPVVFPHCHHAYCLYHLQFNLRDHFPGHFRKGFRNKLVKLFNEIAYAPSVASYDVCVANFCKHGGEKAKTFLQGVPKEHWANAYFEGKRYGEMSSSAIESFNNWVLEARRLPVMNLVDCLRSKLMVQLSNRREESSTWISEICPGMDAKLRKKINKGRAWRVHKSTDGVFEVKSIPPVLVRLEDGTCSCGAWQYNGFPCAHVATVLSKTRAEEESMAAYIDPFYHVVAYQQTYEEYIFPVVAMDIPDFTEGSGREIKPPRNRRPPGRPCLKRIRSRGEEYTARPRKCSRCHQVCRHNRRTCTEPTED